MVEILKSFEQTAVHFSPVVLVVPGLVMAALGLLAWLAGTCLRRLVLGVLGAGAGALVGFFLGVHSPAVAGVAAGGGAAFGAVLPRVFLALLLAVLGMAIAFAIVARTHLLESQGTLFGAQSAEQTESYTPAQSLDAVRAYALDVADRVRAAVYALTMTDWAIIAAVGLGLLVFGLLLVRPATALTCSMLGTALIFGGLVLLLLFKGSAPITHTEGQARFYGLALLGMIMFGTVEQLLVCRGRPRATRARSGKSRAGQEESEHGWRGR